MTEKGRLYGVGLGPGDPEMVTLKARRILEEVSVIFVPKKSARDNSLAEAIVAGLSPELAAKCAGLVLPMVRDPEQLREHWRLAAESVWSHLERGENAALVNVGDPLLYGTFIYVMAALRERHPDVGIEVVPGVSSVTAAAAAAVVPLTVDDENLTVLSGAQPEDVIRHALAQRGTVVFLKVAAVFDRILEIIEDMKLVENAVYVRRCSTPRQEVVRDVTTLRGRELDYFSLLLVRT